MCSSERTPLHQTNPKPVGTLSKWSQPWRGKFTLTLLVLAIGGGLAYYLRHAADSRECGPKTEGWIPNLGNYSMPITTSAGPSTITIQSLFDTALMECFGFAFKEARETSQEALNMSTTATDCPMCYWLEAMTYSPFINHPIASQSNYDAGAAAAMGAARCASETSLALTVKERGLIDAISVRFNSSVENQTIGYNAYQTKLENLHLQIPHDMDVVAFLADAIMILHSDADGYQFYEEDQTTPKPGISHAINLLEECLDTSNHPLCEHLYIHITEPSTTANRAASTADNLALGVSSTQAQHLQHMPSHTYLRIGRYHDAVISNVQAHASDEAYIKHGHLAYGPAHDTAFLVHAAQTSGEQRVAYDYADLLRKHYSQFPQQPDYPGPELGWHIWRTVRLRFGDFDQVLADTDDTPGDWPYSIILGEYAKGVASLVASTPPDVPSAKQHLHSLQATLPSVDESFEGVSSVANLTLASSIEYWNGNLEMALELVQAAREEQESWAYTEPPGWHITVAQCEGTLLWMLGKAEAAVQMFRRDLQNIPENRHSLYGLWRAMIDSAASESSIASVKQRFDIASSWAEPNVPPIVCPHLGE